MDLLKDITIILYSKMGSSKNNDSIWHPTTLYFIILFPFYRF